MGVAIFLCILFLAWLTWSSKAQKETFLFYVWAVMLGASVLQVVPYLFK